MAHSFYDASVQVYQRGLSGLLIILDKAAELDVDGSDASALLGKTVAERLNPVSGQVVSACNRAGNDLRKALRIAVVKQPPPEPTYAAMKARVAATLALLHEMDAAEIEALSDRELTLGSEAKGNLRSVPVPEFILSSSMPQFFFHLTTAYVTLRHNGVPLRKPDFLGKH